MIVLQVAGHTDFAPTDTYRILTTAALLNTPGFAEIIGNASMASANVVALAMSTSTGLQDAIYVGLLAGEQPERSAEESIFENKGKALNPLCERLETSVHATLCSRSIQRTAIKSSGSEALMLDVRIEGTDAFVGEYIVKSSLEREVFDRDGVARNMSSSEERFQTDAVSAFSQYLTWSDTAGATHANLSTSMRAVQFEHAILFEQRGCNESGLQLEYCPADGDTITTAIRFISTSDVSVGSEAVVITKVQALPSCERSTAALVASAGQVDPSTESVRLEAQLLDVDALPITVSRPKVVVVWANKTFPLERTVARSSRFSWEIPAGLRREPGRYAYKVMLEEAWDEVERAKARCSLLEGTLYVGKGFDTTWVLVGSILGAIVLIGIALFLVRRHQEALMVIVVMLVTEIVKLGFSLGLDIGDIVTECVPKARALTRSLAHTPECVRACMRSMDTKGWSLCLQHFRRRQGPLRRIARRERRGPHRVRRLHHPLDLHRRRLLRLSHHRRAQRAPGAARHARGSRASPAEAEGVRMPWALFVCAGSRCVPSRESAQQGNRRGRRVHAQAAVGARQDLA